MNAIIPAPLDAAIATQPRPLVRIVIVGHVDHGKSTLIGRLLHESGSLPDGKLDSLKAGSARRGMQLEWSFLLDALQAERDQGITIDTSQIRFRTPSRDFVLIDAPGHAEFLRNMITGAAQADAAILIVDATEGIRDQTRRHGYLLRLLGIRQIAVVINKMDRIGYDEGRFRDIANNISSYLAGLGLAPTATIPISARNGDGVAQRTPAMTWYSGPTVLEALDQYSSMRASPDLALRLPVQAVYRIDDRRIVAGRIESGRIAVGDEIIVLPSGTRSRIRSIETWPGSNAERRPKTAVAGKSVGITLDDEIFVDRGSVVCGAASRAETGTRLRARVFWLHPSSLQAGARVGVRIGPAEARGVVSAILDAIDPGPLEHTIGESIAQNHVGTIELALDRPLVWDTYDTNVAIGRVVLEFNGRIAGGGLLLPVDTGKAFRTGPTIERRPAAPASTIEKQATRLSGMMAKLSPAQRIALLRREVAGTITFTTSFGLEDQTILHLLSADGLDIDVVTLDTGRLFPETYDLWAETERRYARRIRAVYPKHKDLDALVARQGINGFYESRQARVACCTVRKVEPLNRALNGASAWITGLRGDQSPYRQAMGIVEVDAERGLLKLNPLFDWTRQAVLRFAQENQVPISPLHAKGYASIGCAPCTRPIATGEPERSGRWWWEQEDKKECGLHTLPDRR